MLNSNVELWDRLGDGLGTVVVFEPRLGLITQAIDEWTEWAAKEERVAAIAGAAVPEDDRVGVLDCVADSVPLVTAPKNCAEELCACGGEAGAAVDIDREELRVAGAPGGERPKIQSSEIQSLCVWALLTRPVLEYMYGIWRY